jgi:hypothetical protein
MSFRGNFLCALHAAQQNNKLLLVSIQDYRFFPSHAVNRDIFGDPLIKQLIMEHFILWQVSRDEGQRYWYYFNLDEGGYTFPHLAVVHPETKTLLWAERREWNQLTCWNSYEIAQSLSEIAFDCPYKTILPTGGQEDNVTTDTVKAVEGDTINFADEFAVQEALGMEIYGMDDATYGEDQIYRCELQEALLRSKRDH